MPKVRSVASKSQIRRSTQRSSKLRKRPGPDGVTPSMPSSLARKPAAFQVHRPTAPTTELVQARAAWLALPSNTQQTLARELVETRSAELRLAYPELRAIGHGKRSRRLLGKTGRKLSRIEILWNEWCVTFMVESKWSSKAPPKGSNSQTLPKDLLTYCDVGGQHTLCAVPTDVLGRKQHYSEIQLHNPPVQTRSISAGKYVKGITCCAVQLPAGPVFLVGCHHVFAMSLETIPVPPDVQLYNMNAGNLLGSGCSYYGFVDTEGFFLDAALIELSNPPDLRSTVDAPTNTASWLQLLRDHAGEFAINVPQRPPVSARFFTLWFGFDALRYPWQVKQKWIIEMKFDTPSTTQLGDSGSPVFGSDGVFQGMHIGGNSASAYMIPASELFRAEHYGLTNAAQTLQLV